MSKKDKKIWRGGGIQILNQKLFLFLNLKEFRIKSKNSSSNKRVSPQDRRSSLLRSNINQLLHLPKTPQNKPLFTVFISIKKYKISVLSFKLDIVLIV